MVRACVRACVCHYPNPDLKSGGGTAPVTEAPLQTHRLKESVAPVLSVLTECARVHRPARKFLKAQVWAGGWGVELGPPDHRPQPLQAQAASPGAAPTAGCEDPARGW